MNTRACISTFLPVSAALLVFLNAAPAAHAQLTLTFTPDAQAGTAPGTFAFTGTLTNPTTSDVNLYSYGLTFNGLAAGLGLDGSPFDSAPSDLPAGMSYTGGFFNVSVDPTAAPDTYTGTFAIYGDADPNNPPVATKDFSVTVLPPSAQPVPETSTTVSLGLLLALGLGGIVVARRRKPNYGHGA